MFPKKLSVLVTNDDGCKSPLLLALVKELGLQAWCKEVRVVTPKSEQSWISQAVTRFSEINVEPHDFEGTTGFTVSGTPADCSSLGIHNLYKSKPDLVISGINFGSNAGRAFLLSSGTVGGATEAMLTGVPSIALSARVPEHVFAAWHNKESLVLESHREDFQRIAKTSLEVCLSLLDQELWQDVDFYSVNLPFESDSYTQRAITRISQTNFGRLFTDVKSGEVFQHKFDELVSEKPQKSQIPADRETVLAGTISISPISYDLSPKNISELEEKFK